MLSIVRYFLLICKKDKILFSLFLLNILSFLVSLFFGWTMIDEIKQAQIAYASASMRFISVFGLIVFISFFISKFFSNKELEFMCSLSKNRYQFILSFVLCFVIISFLLVLINLSTMLYFYFTYQNFNISGFVMWSVSLWFELVLISIFTIFLSLGFANPAICIIISICFYLVSRSIGFITSAIYNSGSTDLSTSLLFLPSNHTLSSISVYASKIIGVFFPRLDLITNSSWLMYDNFDVKVLCLVLFQILFYSALIILLSIKDFNRKQF